VIFYALSIFLSAFLLFQIQPMIAKVILPWFGGTPAVWSTVQLFFQVLLTGGYAYAHWLADRGASRKRAFVHLTLLGLVVAQLALLGLLWTSPITPDASLQPHGEVNPVWEIFRILFISVGPAYFLLSSNGPLMQAWFHRAAPAKSPYILYALSNVGSLLGLITYPVLIEPRLSLQEQGFLWSAGFVVFGAAAADAAVRSNRGGMAEPAVPESMAPTGPRPTAGIRLLWILLSACASLLLLATTSHITQEVAVIPFLWVLPLSIYLLSFILAFSSGKWYVRRLYMIMLFIVSLLFIRVLYAGPATPIPAQLFAYSLALFIFCMVCHGELYRLRPEPAHITNFYLMVSIGGALGGAFVNFVAPLIFKGYWELPLGMVLCWILLFVVLNLQPDGSSRVLRRFSLILTLGGALIFGVFAAKYIFETSAGSLFSARNFYGVVRVQERDFPSLGWKAYALVHGITVHGLQSQSPAQRDTPTSYYYEQTGIGLATLNHPRRGQGLRVGVLGLGTGTLAAYGQPGDVYRFYEINPVVIDLAQGMGGYFSFLQDSKARIEIVPGDARISMEQELAAGKPQNYDILALDTFSSDSIPVQLIDKEAFGIYLQHLRPDGVLAVHITNYFLDLKPVVYNLANYYHLNMALIISNGDGAADNAAIWALLTREPALLEVPAITAAETPLTGYSTEIPLWTDDYSNLFQILIRR
jgi:hypothetical protein